MNDIVLQRATVDDVDVFLSLEKSVIGPKTYSGIANRDEAVKEIAENIVYIIKLGDKPVGSIQYVVENDGVVYLSGLVVSPDFQGQGVARQAMEKILEIIGDVKRVYLVTHPRNISVLKISLATGFIIESWQDDFYGDGEPRLIMTRLRQDK
jgi:[ribosomal protein S18]-alanine N-acetyltransferase